jgi:hypothetical protein
VAQSLLAMSSTWGNSAEAGGIVSPCFPHAFHAAARGSGTIDRNWPIDDPPAASHPRLLVLKDKGCPRTMIHSVVPSPSPGNFEAGLKPDGYHHQLALGSGGGMYEKDPRSVHE